MDTDYVKIVLDNLLPIVTGILVPVILVMINKWLKPYLADSQINMLNEFARHSVAYAEEQYHKKTKIDPGAKDEAKKKKLDDALKHMASQIERAGLPKMAQEEMIRLIEARLNYMRD